MLGAHIQEKFYDDLEIRARVAVCNASDADVIFGAADFGEYWRNGDIAGEEIFAMLTTGILGSTGITLKSIEY